MYVNRGKKHIEFMNTAFRDGFQSAYGARVFTKDFLPAVEAAVEAGMYHFEAGGGARFQSLYFYCNEDAFEMMDSFRKAAGPDANLQTLARGINVVGLDSQPRDIIKLHAKLFKKHGITTIRNFDALNDVNNLIYSGQCIVDAGLKHEIVVTMMELPPGVEGAHTPEFYLEVLKKLVESGVHYDSVCFKDASGTSIPRKVYETIKLARKYLPVGTPLRFHTHETAGTSIAAYMAALEAGADAIDLSMAPVSGGTAQPDVATMWHALRGTDYDLGIDINKVLRAEEVFKKCMEDYFLPPEAMKVEPMIPFSPMPGGALTANTQMMRDTGTLGQFPKIIAAMGEVVKRGGFGTSVTPVSQFYFQQAFNNVVFGPWKRIAPGYGKMVLGYFGKTPVEPDPEVVKLAREQLKLEPTEKSPLDINDEDPNKGVEAARKMLQAENLPVTEENIFIAATCKEKGITFLKGEAKIGVRKKKKGERAYRVSVDGKDFLVKLGEGEALVNNVTHQVKVEELEESESTPKSSAAAKKSAGDAVKAAEQQGGETAVQPAIPRQASTASQPAEKVAGSGRVIPINAPLPGIVLRIHKKPGDAIKRGEALLVLEAMKMETDINSIADGIVEELKVNIGDQVASNQVLAKVRES